MNGVGITYLWLNKEFPPFIRLEGKRGDYEVYVPERTCYAIAIYNMHDEWCYDKCSVCDYEWFEDEPNYCPHCGAKVVGE